VHDSGGERALLVDSAARVGVPLARISEQTSARMAELLDPGLLAINPLDFWGTGHDAHEVVTGCIRALLDDPDVAALAFTVDLTTEDSPDMGYITMARATYGETDKPYAMLSNLASGIDRNDVQHLEAESIPVLEGTLTGLAAFRHLFEYRDHRALPRLTGVSPVSVAVRERWLERLSSPVPISEAEGLDLLSEWGVPAVGHRTAASAAEAAEVAEALGYPVAVKTAASGISHKSDVGGVRLGLTDARAVVEAYESMAALLGPEVIVAAMAPAGVEIALGIVRDPQFGPLVLVGAGGLLVEVLKDRRLGMPPLDEARARRLVDGLNVRPLLDGVRGRPAADVDALVRAIVGLSWLAHDLGDEIEALDANPLICGPDGCVAVDALVIPRTVGPG
jgi:acyl-CoA synthetase (NDP forming)